MKEAELQTNQGRLLRAQSRGPNSMSKLKEREAWGRLVMSATGQGCGSGGTCATWDAQLSEPAGTSCPRLRASHSKENWGPEGLWFDAQELKLPFQAGLLHLLGGPGVSAQ